MREVTWTKLKSAETMGEYKPTTVDREKSTSEIRLLQVCPKIIDSKVPLKGRGIKPIANVPGRYQVSDKAWDTLRGEYKWVADF